MMTDHYNLMCYILGIEARPNNGTWTKVKNMTRDSGAKWNKRMSSGLVSLRKNSATSSQINAVAILVALFVCLDLF